MLRNKVLFYVKILQSNWLEHRNKNNETNEKYQEVLLTIVNKEIMNDEIERIYSNFNITENIMENYSNFSCKYKLRILVVNKEYIWASRKNFKK